MAEPVLRIPAADGTPQVDIHVNLIYNLYHYLVQQGMEETPDSGEVMTDAVERAARVRFPLGVHGLWTDWEVPLASGATLRDAITGLRSRMNHTVDTLAIALRETETEYRERIWPQRVPAFETALLTLHEVLAPHFAEMARHQAGVLGLSWPRRLDAYLVADCYDWHSAYSHPLTIDVTENIGLTFCETFLHEATHVADVYTSSRGHRSLSSKLSDHLGEMGISGPAAWNVWHAIIFAASAQQVRAFIDPDHTDYATERGLYQIFKVPDLPRLWAAFIDGSVDEETFLREVRAELRSAG